MKILLLGSSELELFLLRDGHYVVNRQDVITPADACEYGMLISHGYRHIIKPDVLSLFKPQMRINLHISLLPHNRGADPNFWSWICGTPKGTTIHVIDKGLDTGPILCQTESIFMNLHNHTLATTYNQLQDELIKLFKDNWYLLKQGKIVPIEQPSGGSYHCLADRPSPFPSFSTPILDLIGNESSAYGIFKP